MKRLALLILVLALAACGRDEAADPTTEAGGTPATTAEADAGDAPAGEPDAGEPFSRTWMGILPCADCDGIQTRLSLVRDADGQRYQLEETYLGARGDNVFVQQGGWRLDDAGTAYRLDPDGPLTRVFALEDDGALELLDGDGQRIGEGGEYRLQRL